MKDLLRWVRAARQRLASGLLSRAEYEKSLSLNIQLSREISFICEGLHKATNSEDWLSLRNERINDAMRRAFRK